MKSSGKSLLLSLGIEELDMARASLEAKTMSTSKERYFPLILNFPFVAEFFFNVKMINWPFI